MDNETPIAWMRDMDGTGSMHVCTEGDPGAFPVYTNGFRDGLEAAARWHEEKARLCRDHEGGVYREACHVADALAIRSLTEAG